MQPSPFAFEQTLGGLGIAHDGSPFQELVEAYGTADRHYHNLKHIEACLVALSAHHDLAIRIHEVAIALWFHDSIYDPRRTDNEECSARWACAFLQSAAADSVVIERVRRLIIATKHTVAVQTRDEQLLVDIDLGILGQSPQSFAVYDAAIRREYHWVPEDQYWTSRSAVLRSFLNRPRIYHMDRFADLYGRQARSNLANAIVQLDGNV